MASNNQRSFVEEGIPFTSELPNEKIKGIYIINNIFRFSSTKR